MAIGQAPRLKHAGPVQEIWFCRGTADARLAYAVHGAGPPMKAARTAAAASIVREDLQ